MKTIKITEEVHNLLLQEKAKMNFKTLSDTIKYWWALSDWQKNSISNEKRIQITKALKKQKEYEELWSIKENDKSKK